MSTFVLPLAAALCLFVCGSLVKRFFAQRPQRQMLLWLWLVGYTATYYAAPPATMAAPERVRVAMALPEWNDGIVSWAERSGAFADRIATGYGLDPATAAEFAPWLIEASERQQLTPELLAGLVFAESSFRKHATSVVGAIGPAQVRPEYWRTFCGTPDLHEPAENIYCGAQILAYYKDRCGAEACALRHYNIGPYERRQAVQQAGQRYVAKVGHWRDRLVNVSL